MKIFVLPAAFDLADGAVHWAADSDGIGIVLRSFVMATSQTDLVKALVDAGVHFGHRVSRWNPKMEPYIHGKRNMIHLIDVKETLKGLLLAKRLIQQNVAGGKDVVFVGTKRQAKHAEDREHGARDVEQQTELQGEDRASPPDLRHRPDQEMIDLDREDLFQITDDAGDVGDDVLREEHAVERSGLDSRAQHVDAHRTIQPQQSAYAVQ